jgi:hypothetical protein
METGELPAHVLILAAKQALELKEMVRESESSEKERVRRSSKCPTSRRHLMEEKFDRERDQEVLLITRIREEHGALLSHALQSSSVEKTGRAFQRVSDNIRHRKERPATTNQVSVREL